MKPLIKIIILCVIIFVLSVIVAKKSIDYKFKEVECSQTSQIKDPTFHLTVEQI